MGMAALEWEKERVSGELDLKLTLSTGQAFRWHCVEEGVWLGAIQQYVFALKSIGPSTLSYLPLHTPSDHARHTPSHILRDYFRLDTNLTDLCNTWARSDSNFDLKISQYKGVRLLRQDPLENIISFICSSNNNITRISGMINSLCETLGKPICCYGDQKVYSFPSLEQLCTDDMERTLRRLGFGYRAKYVATAAKSIAEKGGIDWLMGLREKPRDEVVSALRSLPGVGPKVADCVALFSCDKLEAVPVDTHVWSYAVRDYGLAKGGKALTASTYKEIGDHFRGLFGPKAGWATSILFVADLGKSREAGGSKAKRKKKDDQTTSAKRRKT